MIVRLLSELLAVADWLAPLTDESRGMLWAAIVVLLFLSGVGLPLPEDVPLMFSGFATAQAAEGHFVLWRYFTTFVIVVIPILVGDLIAYTMGRRWGFPLTQRVALLRRLLSEKRLERVRGWFEHYGTFTVFLGRQVAGVRFATFFTAGVMHMPLHRFVLTDFLGALISVPVWLALGFFAFRYGDEWLDLAAHNVGVVLALVWGAVAVAFIIYLRLRARPKES